MEFTVNISDAVLDDLKRRIKNSRMPDEIINSGWKYGADLSYMETLAGYWANQFDWRKVESQINSYPNYIEEIDGYKIHFIHIRSDRKNSIPLIITHGWPGSFLEMMKIIPILANNKKISFHLIIPSMLGFGFSQRVTEPGCNAYLMAGLWVKLMKHLGYERFIAQGGDFGAGVSTAIALKYPENVLGIHLNYIPGSYKAFLNSSAQLTTEEIEFEKTSEEWYNNEGSYAHQHRTKPLTLAYGLNDSPVGLCAWIIEKFFSWSDCKTKIENIFTKDELLANVTLYWVTETIHSSIRLYNENSKTPFRFTQNDFVKVPVGIAHFPFEEPFPPRKYIERGYNITHWTDMHAGGHFAAMEQPEPLANDIIKFAMSIEKTYA